MISTASGLQQQHVLTQRNHHHLGAPAAVKPGFLARTRGGGAPGRGRAPNAAAAAAAVTSSPSSPPSVPGVPGNVPVVSAVEPLFRPLSLGPGLDLAHRLVLAPLTRCRAGPGDTPAPSAALYYGERAAAPGTLLISEASPISPQARGYPGTPGLWTAEQVEAWRPVVRAVKDAGSVFCAQLWHVGRASCDLYQPGGGPPVSASAIAIPPPWTLYGPGGEGPFPYPTPRPLAADEIDGIVQDFVTAAKNAVAAGFDMVEVHAANGYLLAQFLSDGSNARKGDAYSGASPASRARFLLRVVQAVADALGSAGRVGVRLSPFNEFLACVESRPLATYGHAVSELLKIRAEGDASGAALAYLHFVEPRIDATFEPRDTDLTLAPYTAMARAAGVAVITAGGWEPGPAAEAVASGDVDLVCVGREWIGSPDLPKRWALGLRGNKGDRAMYYSGGEEGYTTYACLSPEEEGAAIEAAVAARRG